MGEQMGKKLFLVFWQLSSCCILTCRRRASEVSSYNDINPIHEGLRGWKSQREEGRRRKRQRERTESLSKKLVKGERKRVVFQERHGRWKFSFKRSALTLKSQVEGFIWEPGDHTITSHLRRSRQSLSYLTEAFDVVHTSQWDFTCQYRRLKRRVQSLGGEDPLEKDKATHCSILAWRIPWTEERGRLQSIGLQRVWYEWSNLVLYFFGKTFLGFCSTTLSIFFFFFILWIFFLSSLGQLILLHLNDLMKFSQAMSEVPSFLMTTLQDNRISILSFRCCLNADNLGMSVLHSERLLQTSQLCIQLAIQEVHLEVCIPHGSYYVQSQDQTLNFSTPQSSPLLALFLWMTLEFINCIAQKTSNHLCYLIPWNSEIQSITKHCWFCLVNNLDNDPDISICTANNPVKTINCSYLNSW